MTHVFISYASKDRETAQELASTWQDSGLKVWWDRKDLPGGEQYPTVIAKAIENAAAVVVLWSANSVESPWVWDEADRALKRNVLIPARIADVQPPMPFGGLQTYDLREWRKDRPSAEFDKLTTQVREKLLMPPLPPRQPAPQRSTPLKWILIGLALVILIVGASFFFKDGKEAHQSKTRFTALLTANGPEVQEASWKIYIKGKDENALNRSGPVFTPDLAAGTYEVEVSAGKATRKETVEITQGQPMDRKFDLDAGELLPRAVLKRGGQALPAVWWIDRKDEKEEGGWRRTFDEGDSPDQRFILPGGWYKVRGESETGGKRYAADETDVFVQSGKPNPVEVLFRQIAN